MPRHTRAQTRLELEERIEALETRNSELLLELMDLAEHLETHFKVCAGATSTEAVEVGEIADRLMTVGWTP